MPHSCARRSAVALRGPLPPLSAEPALAPIPLRETLRLPRSRHRPAGHGHPITPPKHPGTSGSPTFAAPTSGLATGGPAKARAKSLERA